MKRYLVFIVAVWLMLGFAYLYALADDTAVMYVHVEHGLLNGRREPNLDSPIEMTMGSGFEVHVIGVRNGWAEIAGGEPGTVWCCVDYLVDYPPGEDPLLYTVVSNGRVRVRASPDGMTVRYVHDGDTVAVRFIIDGWAYLGDGYVMAEYLELSD